MIFRMACSSLWRRCRVPSGESRSGLRVLYIPRSRFSAEADQGAGEAEDQGADQGVQGSPDLAVVGAGLGQQNLDRAGKAATNRTMLRPAMMYPTVSWALKRSVSPVRTSWKAPSPARKNWAIITNVV